MLLLLGLVFFFGRGKLSPLHSLLFAFTLEAALLILGLFLSLLRFQASRLPPNLPHRAAPVLMNPMITPSIVRVANPTFLTHPLSRFHARPCPKAELSQDQP
jgi:hypothetical protein